MRVVRVIHENPGATRAFIWEQIHGEEVREDSAEADLFKLMIRELSTGGVIRQHRDTTTDGHFLAKRVPTRRAKKTTLESAFEDNKPYELTQLGTQFVHYAMTELVPYRRREREANHGNLVKLCGMDSTLQHLKDSRERLLDS